MIIIGDKEVESNKFTVRLRDGSNINEIELKNTFVIYSRFCILLNFVYFFFGKNSNIELCTFGFG